MEKENKMQEVSSKKFSPHKILSMVMAVVMVMSMTVFASAAETTPVDVDSLLSGVTGSLSDFSTGNLTKILVAGVGIAGGLVLLWFGFGYIKRKLMGALRKGKL